MRAFLVSLFSVTYLTACTILDIREDVHYSYEDGKIAQTLLTKVVPGVTTREWLVDNLGEPVTETIVEQETEVMYQFDEHVNTRTRVLFLFSYRSTKVVPRQLIFALRDDVVSRIGPSIFKDEDE